MSIICVDPRTNPLWQRLIERYESDVFHSPSWIRVLTETYGWEADAYVLLNAEGEPVAGIPFCRIADFMGERIISLPFSDYSDPLVEDHDQWNCLIEEVFRTCCPVILRCLHNDLALADKRFSVVKQAKWHRIDLRRDLDILWLGLHDSARRAINKA